MGLIDPIGFLPHRDHAKTASQSAEDIQASSQEQKHRPIKVWMLEAKLWICTVVKTKRTLFNMNVTRLTQQWQCSCSCSRFISLFELSVCSCSGNGIRCQPWCTTIAFPPTPWSGVKLVSELRAFYCRPVPLRLDDGQVHFVGFLGKSRLCYINGHHKQYILVNTIFNYSFHFGLPGICLWQSIEKYTFQKTKWGAGSSSAKKVCFEDMSKDIFLEVQNEKCS